MTSSNLSIVFGPNILRKKNADPYDTTGIFFFYIKFKYLFVRFYLDLFHYSIFTRKLSSII